MRTPAGQDCVYFYGDYHRGRNVEECRLLGSEWVKSLCFHCSIPGILRANACESMRLTADVRKPLNSFFRKRVFVTAFCEKNSRTGFDPHIGCGECHPVPSEFMVK